MSLEVTSHPNREDESKIIEGTRAYNGLHVPKDFEPLCVWDRLESGEIVGGLTGKTYWNYLDIGFLWVADAYRHQGRGAAILKAAEEEALRRGCRHVLLDTYSFQALGFYRNLGYREFGCLSGFAGNHTRHYLHKDLSPAAGGESCQGDSR